MRLIVTRLCVYGNKKRDDEDHNRAIPGITLPAYPSMSDASRIDSQTIFVMYVISLFIAVCLFV